MPTAPPSTNFNPRSPGGERPCHIATIPKRRHFNPRSPGGERPFQFHRFTRFTDFNPRSPGGERPLCIWISVVTRVISIRAPQVGSVPFATCLQFLILISIRAPQVGSVRLLFSLNNCNNHFNPRSPGGERHRAWMETLSDAEFQSALPRWGASIWITQN